MDMKSLLLVTFAVAMMHLQGCATPVTAGNDARNSIPPANPALDHYIAWVPRKQAATATVARARTHVALGDAKERTAKSLCDGAWLLDGPVVDRVGPVAVVHAVSGKSVNGWYYRISRSPGIRNCGNASKGEVYESLAAHLPGWLNLETAGRLSLAGLSTIPPR